jgi:hypothetical protein
MGIGYINPIKPFLITMTLTYKMSCYCLGKLAIVKFYKKKKREEKEKKEREGSNTNNGPDIGPHNNKITQTSAPN